jgi:hypothetical protein
MRTFLRLSSFFFLLFLCSCAAPYKGLQQDTSIKTSALRFRPQFDKVLYRCVVDGRVVLKKFHLSGLLFFKTMEDGTTRAVFQNEMGFTFFDFEWDLRDSFKVNSIIPQLDKPALIKTLEKDMNLLLLKNLDASTEAGFTKEAETLHRFTLKKGMAWYVEEGGVLKRIENTGKSKVITIELKDKRAETGMPAAVLFKHHKANFTISLNRIESHAEE